MKRKYSKPPAARVKNPLARVTITEKSLDADQFLQHFNPAQMAQLLAKYAASEVKVRENRRRAVRPPNESRQQDAQQRKQVALGIAERLKQQDRTLRLPRKISELARRVHLKVPKTSTRTIRRWFSEK